jgi:4a-hydroxytetrahydrobiopterin dehydratase
MTQLVAKTCTPCRGGVPPLAGAQIEPFMKEVPGWELIAEEPFRIRHEFRFKDFKEAVAFVNRVAELAEAEGHHPDFAIHYNRVALVLYTHKIKGLHENDFIMAAKINQITVASLLASP